MNVSSEAALTVAPFHGAYSASKLAVNGFSDALRRELKPKGVQVSVIVAGSIDTPIWEKGLGLSFQAARRRPPELNDVYGQSYRKVRRFLMRMAKRGIEPQSVAEVITHALTAKRAKHYYTVGSDARLYSLLKAMVPEPFQDWIVFRELDLH